MTFLEWQVGGGWPGRVGIKALICRHLRSRIPGLKRLRPWGTKHRNQEVLTHLSRQFVTHYPGSVLKRIIQEAPIALSRRFSRRLIRPAHDRWRRFTLRNTILPGTTTMTSVPDPGELTTVISPPIRPTRSLIPGKPKCPSFPRSAMTGSIPTPSSLTLSFRSFEYFSSTFNCLHIECVHAFRMAS